MGDVIKIYLQLFQWADPPKLFEHQLLQKLFEQHETANFAKIRKLGRNFINFLDTTCIMTL